ncbi:MAG: M3 family metallopeptidase [Nitriliruptorales bacterium]|nr:M3 family metallopeptidase [Nitriliruptorales bacterium]
MTTSHDPSSSTPPDPSTPPDFTGATVASVQRAVDDAIAEAEQHVADVLATDPGFAHTLAPLDQLTATLAEAYGRGPFYARVHPDEEVRNAASAAEEKLRKWEVGLASRRDLYLALEAFAETDEADELDGEQARLLAHWRRDFRRAGTHLPERQRAEAQRLRERLVELEVAFQRNVDEYEDAIEVTRDELAGLPDDYVEGLDEGDEHGTYKVSLDYPERFPFLQQAEARDRREELAFKAGNISVEDNRAILGEVLQLRDQLAELLGHESWAHHAMEPRMADPDRVEELYDELIPPLTSAATQEVDRLEELLAADGHDAPLRTWDYRYYDTRLRREEHGLDPDELKQYFPLEAVLDGMLGLTAEVLGLRYVASEDADAWHEDVRRFEIRDAESDEHIAWFYMDLHPRPGKFTHAAVFPLVPGRRTQAGFVRPVAAIVANFPKPSGDRPALLRHDDVETLFHEFGHILHDCLTRAEFARFSGTNTEWDFVEAPSQIMEHWAWHPDVLKRFARHHETGEPIPDQLVKQLVATRYVNRGLSYLRQCYFGRLDLLLHVAGEGRDLEAINRDAHAVTLLPFHEGTFTPASFAHIMGGYDAGYYGYLWAQVFGDDMFSRFEEEGVTSPDVGREYREKVLEPGGSKDAEELLRDFLGREPSKEAFLHQLGIND